MRVYNACVRSSLLCPNNSVLRKLDQFDARALRAIALAPSHITRESTSALRARLGIASLLTTPLLTPFSDVSRKLTQIVSGFKTFSRNLKHMPWFHAALISLFQLMLTLTLMSLALPVLSVVNTLGVIGTYSRIEHDNMDTEGNRCHHRRPVCSQLRWRYADVCTLSQTVHSS